MIPYIYNSRKCQQIFSDEKHTSEGLGGEKEESLEGDGNVLYFDYSGGFAYIYI